MAEQKTLPSEESVEVVLGGVVDERRRADGVRLCGLLEEWTGHRPVMWGASIVGFGPSLVLYLAPGLQEGGADLLERLGPHKAGKGCLYVKRLDEVDHDVLRELVAGTVSAHAGA